MHSSFENENIPMWKEIAFRLTRIKDLTIWQRRHPRKRRWKIDFASFHFFSRLFQGAQLLKRREFSLELKRRDHAWVLTEMVEFIVLPFPFPSKLKIWSFHVVVVQWRQRSVQKSVMRVQSCCLAHQTYCFLTFPLPSSPWFCKVPNGFVSKEGRFVCGLKSIRIRLDGASY